MGIMRDTNFIMTRGDTEAFGFEVDGLGSQEFEAVKFSCKKRYGDTSYRFQKTLGDGISRVPNNNKYIVRIAPEDTEKLPAGDYVYDLEVKINGDRFTIMRGKIKIMADVTREGE